MSDSQSKAKRDAVSAALTRINDAWGSGAIDELETLLHQDMVMAFPGFSGRAAGREAVLAGFRDFCENARLQRFEERDRQVDLIGDVGVASFGFEMHYERDGQAYRSSGRDLWVFRQHDGDWLAVWRTMLDVTDEPLPPAETRAGE